MEYPILKFLLFGNRIGVDFEKEKYIQMALLGLIYLYHQVGSMMMMMMVNGDH